MDRKLESDVQSVHPALALPPRRVTADTRAIAAPDEPRTVMEIPPVLGPLLATSDDRVGILKEIAREALPGRPAEDGEETPPP